MKKKILELNLAELTEEELFSMLDGNETNLRELMLLLDNLFEMWAAALNFSSSVIKYGEKMDKDFLEEYTKQCAPSHGVDPQRLIRLIRSKKRGHHESDNILH